MCTAHPAPHKPLLTQTPYCWSKPAAVSNSRQFACAMQAVVALSMQYRMAADIMLLANTIVYGGQLTCGSEAVAARSLALQPGVVGGLPQWLQRVRLHQDMQNLYPGLFEVGTHVATMQWQLAALPYMCCVLSRPSLR